MNDFVELTALDDRKILVRKSAIILVQANFAASGISANANALVNVGGMQQGFKETVAEVAAKL